MPNSFDRLHAILKAHGQSYTNSRQIVFSALKGREAMTMHELVEACSDEINRTSVYRTIALFETLGIVHRLQSGWKYKIELTGDFHSHHHHLTCNRCGRSEPIMEDRILESRLQQLAHKRLFQIKSHQIEVYGLCEICAMKSKKTSQKT